MGGYLTQSYATNFHEFYTAKVLTATESIDDWKEVTATQKTALEAADAKWEQPTEALLETAKREGVTYNAKTGYFEYGGDLGLKDLTAANVRAMVKYGRMQGCDSVKKYRFVQDTNFRMPLTPLNGAQTMLDLTGSYQYAYYVEVVNMNTTGLLKPTTFDQATGLKRVYGDDWWFRTEGVDNTSFTKCTNLELCHVKLMSGNLYFDDCPKLGLESLEWIVAHAANTKASTIRLNPTTYGKLTDELIEAAAAKQITFAKATL